MYEVLRVIPLKFVQHDSDEDINPSFYYTAQTPIGFYEYRRDGKKIAAVFIGAEDSAPFEGMFPDAVQAQLACAKDFRSRVLACLELCK